MKDRMLNLIEQNPRMNDGMNNRNLVSLYSKVIVL